MTSGFEHSIANMTVFAVALLSNAIQGATLAGAVYNLVVVTIGNIVGGALVMGLGAYLLGKEDVKVKA
ncbi:formate/nitrite transporter family protein [Romboutsia sp.]|uniref:formate/nitrite transporter family protein n=1 Tax=Romboutsia sp. TaxID=1965302 RepID=UPI003F307707